MVRNMNSGIAKRLLSRLGSEEALFTMSADELSVIGHLPHNITDEQYRKEVMQRAVKEENFIISNDIEPLYFNEPDYPTRLANCSDGPAMLYQLGNCNLEARHVISIVGTRHATPYGIDVTNRIVKELGESLDDLVIVSGLAYGIDVAAHKAALDNNIPTVAVMAHPLNTIYPPEHRNIAVQMIRNGGAILTEYSSSDQVYRANFLARNRIVAGLSDVTIVVESDSKGGSLTTATLASEYNREVFAVPGRLTDKYSKGTLNLIASNRAHIYTSVEELIEEMGWTSIKPEGTQMNLAVTLSESEQKIYNYLIDNPAATINDILIATEIPTGKLKDLLFDMEMKDLVLSIAGARYSAIST